MLAPVIDHGLWFMTGRIHFHVSKADNADGLSVVEHIVPQGFGPPLHVHHDEDETFHVIEGSLRVHRDEDSFTVRAGAVFCLPRGVPHGFKVLSPEGARVLTITCGGFEDMLRAASRPAEHEGLPEQAPPTPEQQSALARLCAANGIELLGPPID